MCSDPETAWYPQRSVCWATATRQNVTRKMHKRYEKAQPDRAGYLPDDGTTYWVSTVDLTPDDDFDGAL